MNAGGSRDYSLWYSCEVCIKIKTLLLEVQTK